MGACRAVPGVHASTLFLGARGVGVERTFAMNEDPKITPLLVLLELFVGDDTFCCHYFHCARGRSKARPR